MVGVGGASGLVGSVPALRARRAFAPEALPTWLPRLVLLVLGAAGVIALADGWISGAGRPGAGRSGGARSARRSRRAPPSITCWRVMWDLVRGAAQLKQPAPSELGRRYAEMLAENIGQPGFRELLVAVHDLDAHRDLVFALVAEHRRRDLVRRPTSAARGRAPGGGVRPRGRRRASICPTPSRQRSAIPLATEAHPSRFAPDAYWRGETHRLCDRPAGLIRLIDELIDLGVEQIVLVSAAPELPGPHALAHAAARRPRAARRIPAVDRSRHRPRRDDDDRRRAHVHDPARAQSDRSVRLRRRLRRSIARRQGLGELMSRGYEDAYHQFIEPVVGASGERVGKSEVRSQKLIAQQSETAEGLSSRVAIRLKGPATELIHAGEVDRGDAVPLTTPIYETTTFVFDNAQEVVAYNEGRSPKYLYSRYTNPTVVSVEAKLAALDRTEAALLFSSGHGRDGDDPDGAPQGGRRGRLQRGDLRRHAAPAAGSARAASAITPRFVSLDELANPERV